MKPSPKPPALKQPMSGETADQCREMGIAVGETIEGRETHGADWNEVRLTLLYCGRSECVWSETSRSNREREWSEPEESTSWTLDARRWRKTGAALTTVASE